MMKNANKPIKRLNYMTRAIRLTGADIDDEHTELIYRIMQIVQKKGGNTSLKDITEIQASVHRHYQESPSRHDRVSSTNNPNTTTMEEHYLEELQTALDNAKKEAYAFYGKGNKAAGTRLRKQMLDIKQKAQDIRVDIQERKNS